jgi:hypothetical protein
MTNEVGGIWKEVITAKMVHYLGIFPDRPKKTMKNHRMAGGSVEI